MKKTLVLAVVIALYILIGVLVSVFAHIFTPDNPYRTDQENLAKKLGVQIGDYPYETAFPEGYFYTILKPGMTIQEVHNIVQGYEKVLHCKTYSEIYYYFSSEDSSALRFEIRYDERGKYKELQGEDEDSRTIFIEGCEEGLIEIEESSRYDGTKAWLLELRRVAKFTFPILQSSNERRTNWKPARPPSVLGVRELYPTSAHGGLPACPFGTFPTA